MKLTVPVDEAALNMLKACLNKDPALRPNAETLLRHNYFAGLSIPDFLERSISAHKTESKSNGNLSGKPPSVYSKYAKSVQLNGVINSSLNKYKVCVVFYWIVSYIISGTYFETIQRPKKVFGFLSEVQLSGQIAATNEQQ